MNVRVILIGYAGTFVRDVRPPTIASHPANSTQNITMGLAGSTINISSMNESEASPKKNGFENIHYILPILRSPSNISSHPFITFDSCPFHRHRSPYLSSISLFPSALVLVYC